MKRWSIILFILVFVALVSVAGYLGFQTNPGSAAATAEPPQTVSVSRGEVERSVSAPGQLVNTRQASLQSRLSGRVEEVLVLPGDQVTAGQVLVQLGEKDSFEAALAKAEIEVLEAQKALQQVNPGSALSQAWLDYLAAKEEFETAEHRWEAQNYPRGTPGSIGEAKRELELAKQVMQQAERQLKETNGRKGQRPASLQYTAAQQAYQDALDKVNYLEGTPDDDEVAELEAKYNMAKANLEAAKQKYEQLLDGNDIDLELAQARLKNAQTTAEAARIDLDNLEVKAPFDGIVTSVGVTAGQDVSAGAQLLDLIDPAALEIRATVVEEDLPLIEIGQLAQVFFDAMPELELKLKGQVTRIVPERVEGDRAVYNIYIGLDNLPASLIPGMTSDASILIEGRQDVLRLPRAVVRANADNTAQVKVWDGQAIEEREVQVGLRGDTFVEILSGLEEGEKVAAQ